MSSNVNKCCICFKPCANEASNPMLNHSGAYRDVHLVDKKCMQAWWETNRTTLCPFDCGIHFKKREIVTEEEEKRIKAKRILITGSFAALGAMTFNAVVDLAAAKIVDVCLAFLELSSRFVRQYGPANRKGQLFLRTIGNLSVLSGLILLIYPVAIKLNQRVVPVIYEIGDSFRGFNLKACLSGIKIGSKIGRLGKKVIRDRAVYLMACGVTSSLFAAKFAAGSKEFAEDSEEIAAESSMGLAR